MEVHAAVHQLTVLTFPHEDGVFAEHVTELLEAHADNASPEDVARDIERALRAIYPRVATSFRDRLAGFGDLVMYVFRDGTARSSFESDGWILDPDTARVVTDPAGTYVDANQAALHLFGVGPSQLLGARAGSFTRPDARINDDKALWSRLDRTGKLHSLAILTRGDGSEVSVEFITVRGADGDSRNVTYLRTTD